MNHKLRKKLAKRKKLARQSAAPAAPTKAPAILIVAESGGRQQRLGFIDPGGAELERYLKAPNLTDVIKERKSGHILRLHIAPHGDDTKMESRGAGQALTYDEPILEQYHLEVLKIWDEYRQCYRKWGEKDSFNPWRFNPDTIRVHAGTV